MVNQAEDLVKIINATVNDMGGFKEFENSSCYVFAEKQLIHLRPECKSCKSCNTKFRFFNNKYTAKNVQPRYQCRDCRHMFTMGGKGYKKRQHLEKPEQGERCKGKQHLEKPEPESASVPIYKMQDHVEHQQQFTVSSQSSDCQQQHQQQQQQSFSQDLLFRSTFQRQQQISARSDQDAEFQLQHQYVQKQAQHVQAHTHYSDLAAEIQSQLQHYPQPQPQLQQPSCNQEIQNQQFKLPARSDAVAVLLQHHHTHKQRSIHESDSVHWQTEINLLPQVSVRSDSVAGVQLQQHHGQEPPQSVQTREQKLLPGSCQHGGVKFEQHHMQEQLQRGQPPIHDSHQHVALQLQPLPLQSQAGINLLQQELLWRSDPVVEVQLQQQQPLQPMQPGNHESDEQLEIIQEGVHECMRTSQNVQVYGKEWLEDLLLDGQHAELQTFSKQSQTEINLPPQKLPLRSYSNAEASEVQLQQFYGQDLPLSVQTHNHESAQDTTLQLQLQTQKQVSQKSDPAAAGDQVQKHYVQEPPKTVLPHNDEFDQDASLKLGLQIPQHQRKLFPGLCQLEQHHIQEQLQPGQLPSHDSHQHVALQLQPLSLQSQAGSNLVLQQLLSISDSGVQLEQQPPQPMQPPNHESDQDATTQLQLQSPEQRTGVQFQEQYIQKEPRNHGFHQDIPIQHQTDHHQRPQAQSYQQEIVVRQRSGIRESRRQLVGVVALDQGSFSKPLQQEQVRLLREQISQEQVGLFKEQIRQELQAQFKADLQKQVQLLKVQIHQELQAQFEVDLHRTVQEVRSQEQLRWTEEMLKKKEAMQARLQEVEQKVERQAHEVAVLERSRRDLPEALLCSVLEKELCVNCQLM